MPKEHKTDHLITGYHFVIIEFARHHFMHLYQDLIFGRPHLTFITLSISLENRQ